MEGDIFTNRHNRESEAYQFADSNFFLQPEQITVSKGFTEPSRHLNDYDYNILKEDAYKDVKDEVFKLEYKINKVEQDIKDLDSQIKAATDIADYIKANNLVARKKQLLLDLDNLNEIYNDTSLSAKISGGMSDKLNNKIKNLKGLIKNVTNSIILKLPGKMSSFIKLKNSLEKLENINKSVDELITLQIPYGENIDKYEQLTRYIIKANSIQSDIAKVWKR